MLLGDLNTGIRGVDETGRTFAASDRFVALADHGWRDGWREVYGADAQRW